MLGKESAKTALERTAAFHGRLTGNKEDNVVGHETEDGVDVACSGGPMPPRNKIANGLFFSVHGNSLCDAQQANRRATPMLTDVKAHTGPSGCLTLAIFNGAPSGASAARRCYASLFANRNSNCRIAYTC
jgi:hypothetical protein